MSANQADFSLENQYKGLVCGIDEVGRGPLAGPVVAACVVIPKDKRDLDFIADIKDSKKLNAKKRETLFNSITANFPFAISELSPEEIDEHNILQASLLAMKKTHDELVSKGFVFECALIDGNKIPIITSPAIAVVKGDGKSKSIAAASIVAKVYRDRIMHRLSEEYPEYGWARNSGYPTKEHKSALEKHGVTSHHRKSFSPVRIIIESTQ